MFLHMANVGLRANIGFCRIPLTIMCAFPVNTWSQRVAASGVIFFGGVTRCGLYRRVVMGDLIKEGLPHDHRYGRAVNAGIFATLGWR